MSTTAYVLQHHLNDGHSGTINALAFSPDGMYLASGSDDESVIVWNLPLGRYFYRCLFRSPVDSLLWNPVEEETLIVGCQSGALKQIRNFSLDEHEEYDIRLGSRSHIYCLDYHPATRRLAVGMGTEVHITREVSPNNFSGDIRLPHPHEGHGSGDTRDRAVALKFDQSGLHLVVTYLNHGVRCYDVKTSNQLWRIQSPASHAAMGHSAVSPDFRSIAVHNFMDGIHLYRIGAFDRLKSPRLYPFDSNPDQRIALQVSFAHGGKALVCGSSTGNVCIWDVASGDFFQQLDHNGRMVMAIAVCSHEQSGYIATGSVAVGGKASVKVWRAKIANNTSLQVLGHTRSWRMFKVAKRPIVQAARCLPSKQDVRTAILTSIFIAFGVLIARLSCALYENVPWKVISDCFLKTINVFVSKVVYFCRSSTLLVAYGLKQVSEALAALYRSALRWARVRVLQMLGIPLHMLDDLVED